MLNRSLFEDMVDGHWVTVDPELAVKRLKEHDLHGKMLLAEAAIGEELIPPEEVPIYDAERRGELDTVFGEHGQKSWTGLGLHKRVELIEHLWSDPSKAGLPFVRRIVHRENNQLLHISAYAIGEQIRSHDEHGVSMSLGPGLRHVDKALLAAFWIFGQLVSHVLTVFEFDVADRWSEVYAEQFPEFAEPDTEPS